MCLFVVKNCIFSVFVIALTGVFLVPSFLVWRGRQFN